MRWKRQRGTEVEVSYIREGEDNISFLNCFERPVPERTWISLSEGLLPALLRMRGRANDCRGDRKRERRGGGLGGGWQVTCLSLTPVWTLHHLTLNQNCCRWRAGSYLPCIIRHNLHRCSLHHSGRFRARIQGPVHLVQKWQEAVYRMEYSKNTMLIQIERSHALIRCLANRVLRGFVHMIIKLHDEL